MMLFDEMNLEDTVGQQDCAENGKNHECFYMSRRRLPGAVGWEEGPTLPPVSIIKAD